MPSTRPKRPGDRSTMEDPGQSKGSGRFAWGLLDQALSSATNFALVLFTARWLGPARLGVVAIGVAAFVLALVVYRALITSPLVVVSGRLLSDSLADATQMGVAVGLLAATLASACLATIGFLIPGGIGHGLLLFAPWIGLALVQDLWRAILFRDSRGRSAVLNDSMWVLGMALTLPFAWKIHTEWAVVSSWGFGALLGAVLGLFQTRSRIERFGAAYRWWLRELWPLGRWFAMDRVALNIGTQGSIFLLATFLSRDNIGGLRAVQSVFAPLTLLGPAIVLPGLPAIVRLLPVSTRRAWVLGLQLSALITGLAIAYMAVVGAGGGKLFLLAFTSSFRRFRGLLVPVAVAQVFVAAGVGTAVLLQAGRNVRGLIISRAAGAMVSLPAAWWLGHRAGMVGGAWGLAIGAGLTTLLFHVHTWSLSQDRASPGAHDSGLDQDGEGPIFPGP
jgi:O-antigen/teichoic acid export membrane protein